MTSFKEFLETQKMEDIPKTSRRGLMYYDQYISKKALGNFAFIQCIEILSSWKNAEKRLTEIKEHYSKDCFNEGDDATYNYAYEEGFRGNYFLIAIDCLGEKEIIRKLRELK